MNITFLSFLLFLLILISNNVIEFTPWSQVAYIHDVLTDNTRLFSEVDEKFHIFRYIAVYPAYFLSDVLKIKITKTFSIYVISALLSTSLIWKRICKYKMSNKFETFIKSIIPLSLAFIINGRFAFSLLGISIIILGNLLRRESKNKYYFVDIFGLIFISVSSGTLIVGVFLFLFSNFKDIKKDIKYIFFDLVPKYRSISEYLFFLPIFLTFSISFLNLIVFTNKNIYYFGGYKLETLSNILSHGLGFFLVGNTLNFLLIFVLILLIYFYFNIFKSNELDIVFKKLVFISSFSGLFGISSFMTILAIVPLINSQEIFTFTKRLLKKNNSEKLN